MLSKSEKQTEKIAEKFAAGLLGGEIILMEGELGAGKTVFARGMARAFGIAEPVRSPTFTLMHVHKTKKRARGSKIKFLVHIDAYRLSGAEDLRGIGIEEYMGRTDAITVIEWGSKAKPLLKNLKPIFVKIGFGRGESERKLEFFTATRPRRKLRPRL